MSTKIARTLPGLRSALLDELDAIREGNGDTDRVKAICQIAGRFNELTHTEIKVRRLLATEAPPARALKELL